MDNDTCFCAQSGLARWTTPFIMIPQSIDDQIPSLELYAVAPECGIFLCNLLRCEDISYITNVIHST